MQNPIQKSRQNSIVFEKPGILSENLKTLTSSNYPTVQYFLLKLCTRFLLTNIYKSVSGIFFILFRSWVINKNVKRPWFLRTRFLHFQITTVYSDLLSKVHYQSEYTVFIWKYLSSLPINKKMYKLLFILFIIKLYARINISRIFSSVTFLMMIFSKEKSGKSLLKPGVKKWHLSGLSTM